MKNNYVVSLTTIPSKFDNLHLTIDSLINQTILPNKIIINIPKIYNFRLNCNEIPLDKINAFLDKYSKFNCIINLSSKDYGPGTKLLGLFDNDIIHLLRMLNTYIILVDDDLIYSPRMIETFDKEINKSYMEVGSCYVYDYNGMQIGQGADGFIMKLTLLDKFLKYYSIFKDYDYINYHDDFYISYYFEMINKKIKHVIAPDNLIYKTHPKSFVDALARLRGKYARDNLNRQVHEILTKLTKDGYFYWLKKRI